MQQAKIADDIFIPQPIVEDSNWIVKIAETRQELDTVYKLRYEVFNLELNVGFDSSFFSEQDKDVYDDQFLHMVVIDKKSEKVIATYRVQNYAMARAGVGFLSAAQFNFNQFPLHIQQQGLEVSRACIARKFRNSKVFHFLWRGLAILLYENRLRYFFGCSSVPSTNNQDANGLVKLLQAMEAYHSEIYVEAQPGYECAYKDEEVDITQVVLPPLFNLYLRFRCYVCSAPSREEGFKTIDFLTVYDASTISDRHRKMFFGDRKKPS